MKSLWGGARGTPLFHLGTWHKIKAMVPSMQFAWDQILNPLHKKESRQRKEMNHPLSRCFESNGLNSSAVITAPDRPSAQFQTTLGLRVIHGVTACPGKTFLPPGFRWVALLVELKSNLNT